MQDGRVSCRSTCVLFVRSIYFCWNWDLFEHKRVVHALLVVPIVGVIVTGVVPGSKPILVTPRQ